MCHLRDGGGILMYLCIDFFLAESLDQTFIYCSGGAGDGFFFQGPLVLYRRWGHLGGHFYVCLFVVNIQTKLGQTFRVCFFAGMDFGPVKMEMEP